MNSPCRDKLDREKVITELYAQGLDTSPAISKRTGLPASTVRRSLRRRKAGHFVVDGVTPEDHEAGAA